jgi:hypothetical protein
MAEQQEVHNLAELLEALARAGDGKDEASVEDIHEAIGIRSFGPLLLAAGLIGLTPIGGIPAVPTAIAVIVILIASQLLIGLRGFWLPKFIRRRSVSRNRLHTAIRFVGPVARGVDRLIRPRLSWLTERPFTHAIAAICILIALLMPPLELVPFAGTAPALAVTLFGLGLIARDGAVIALAFGFSAASFYLAARSLW